LDISTDNSGWSLKVEAIELLGAERLVYATLNDERVIIRCDEHQPSPAVGSTIYATPRPDKVHQFDAAIGKRIA
jgi:sn-glycerol 3-phosphate transport system ATP-binding protein